MEIFNTWLREGSPLSTGPCNATAYDSKVSPLCGSEDAKSGTDGEGIWSTDGLAGDHIRRVYPHSLQQLVTEVIRPWNN